MRPAQLFVAPWLLLAFLSAYVWADPIVQSPGPDEDMPHDASAPASRAEAQPVPHLLAASEPAPREGVPIPPRREGDAFRAQAREQAERLEREGYRVRTEAERVIEPARREAPEAVSRAAPRAVQVRVPLEQMERMRSWLDMAERYVRLARSPVDSAIAAIVTANDLLRPRGPQVAIEYFTGLLPEVKNDAVQRAIRLQLVELHKGLGQQEQALEHLRNLITAAPPALHEPPPVSVPAPRVVPHQPFAPPSPVPRENR